MPLWNSRFSKNNLSEDGKNLLTCLGVADAREFKIAGRGNNWISGSGVLR